MANTGNDAAASLPPAKPNFLLLMLGMVLAAAPVVEYVARQTTFPPPIQALLIAGAMVLVLYGIYPVPAMAGTFGRLSVAGPAALGLFIFLFVWKSLAISPDRQFLVVQNLQDGQLNTAQFPGGATVTLLDVDSLSDSKLASILDAVRSAIVRGGNGSAGDVMRLLRSFYGEIVQSLNFGTARQADAMKLFDDYQADSGDAEGIDARWQELVTQIAAAQSNPQNYLKRVKREPFAIVKINEGGKIRLELVLPGKQLVVNATKYSVPVIANPALTVTRGIQEALVIQLQE